jgi:hypothetical protein
LFSGTDVQKGSFWLIGTCESDEEVDTKEALEQWGKERECNLCGKAIVTTHQMTDDMLQHLTDAHPTHEYNSLAEVFKAKEVVTAK